MSRHRIEPHNTFKSSITPLHLPVEDPLVWKSVRLPTTSTCISSAYLSALKELF